MLAPSSSGYYCTNKIPDCAAAVPLLQDLNQIKKELFLLGAAGAKKILSVGVAAAASCSLQVAVGTAALDLLHFMAVAAMPA